MVVPPTMGKRSDNKQLLVAYSCSFSKFSRWSLCSRDRYRIRAVLTGSAGQFLGRNWVALGRVELDRLLGFELSGHVEAIDVCEQTIPSLLRLIGESYGLIRQ